MTKDPLRRLQGRSVAELADRARQAFDHWREARGFGDASEPDAARLTRLAGPDDARPAVRGVFFASLVDRRATLTALHAVDPGFEATLRARADRILDGRYDLLGHRDLRIEDPIDWAVDPVSGGRAPAGDWNETMAVTLPANVDLKLIWELGRHRALLVLGQAWWCTGDSRYASRCEQVVTDWLNANPPKRGVHWASSLEVSLRAIAWTWVLALCGEALSTALRRRMLGRLAISARHIERYRSTWFSPNTHLTGEALGLFVLGTAFPQCPDARQWQQLGAAILLECLDRHVRADGSYVEQSTWYHRYTTDFYLHFLVLAERAGIQVRDRVLDSLGRLLEHLAWITRPDGSMPLIGDDDGGRLLFLDDGTALQPRSPLAIGAALLGRPDLAAVAERPTAELVWLLGPEGLSAFRSVVPEIPAAASRAFPDGGLHVMRSGWDAGASVMTVDAGPHGFQNGGHAHADALGVDLAVAGRPLLVDPGTYTYASTSAWRDRFRETAMHNAAVVDGCGSASIAGTFQWSSQVTARAEAWYDPGDRVLFSGTHDGFERLRPPVRYRRSIAFVRPDLWIIRDAIDAEGEHELAVHWQCAAGVEAEVGDRGGILRADESRPVELQVAEGNGAWSVSDGCVAPVYGVRCRAPHLRFIRRGHGALVVTTMIAHAGLVRAAPLPDESGAIGCVEITWGTRRFLFGTGPAMRPGWLESDATVWFIEYHLDGSCDVCAANVSRLIVSGQDLLGAGTRVKGIWRPGVRGTWPSR